MPRSRSSDTVKTKKDLISISDRDPFFQTFEKPTQIYRYLKTRFVASPLFLHRNLSYMKGRSTRNHKRRACFKIIDMMKNKNEETEKDANANENLIIAFVRFKDEVLNAKNVKVETKLEKVSHKRRKEGTSGQNLINIGLSKVDVNVDNNGSELLPAICVTNDQFERENPQTSYQLTFDIEAITAFVPKDSGDEQPSKLPCVSKQYHAELPVYDKCGRNLLLSGVYHVTALETNFFRPSRMPCWESFSNDSDQHIMNWAEEVNKHFFAEKDTNPFKTFESTPQIELYIKRSRSKPLEDFIERPTFLSDHHNNNSDKENTTNNNSITSNGVNGHHNNSTTLEPSSKPFIFQFVVNSSTKQRTEERMDFVCPWCSLNCMRIYSLLKHLKLSHARLLFQYIDEGSKGRIDVYVNDMYDGSYSGAPHDVLLGSQRGPTRRNVVTNIMVFRPRRPTYNMTEFLEADDGELDQQRQYISGHNRIYYHSETCIPIMPKELDYDSEGEPDPKWLQRTTKQMIDEFTDVNGGEKELMKLWNLHIMKHLFVGDCQISLACDLFLNEKGKELIEKNLTRNYIVHLSSLFNYGLISPRTIDKNIKTLNKLQKEFTDRYEIKKARQVQTQNWLSRSDQEVNNKKFLDNLTPTKSGSSLKLSGKGNKSETKSTIGRALPKNIEASQSGVATKTKTVSKRKLSMA